MKIEYNAKQMQALDALSKHCDIRQVLYGGGVYNYISLVAQPKYKSCILVV